MNIVVHWSDAAVQSSIIGALGAVLASSIAAAGAGLIGRSIAKRQTLQEKLLIAEQDVAFLLKVEARHCELHRSQEGRTLKVAVRDEVRAQDGLDFSGKFTLSDIRRHLAKHH